MTVRDDEARPSYIEQAFTNLPTHLSLTLPPQPCSVWQRVAVYQNVFALLFNLGRVTGLSFPDSLIVRHGLVTNGPPMQHEQKQCVS